MRASAARVFLPAVAVLALVAVVAVAATGSTPSGSTDTRKPADTLFDTIFSLLGLVALVVAAALLALADVVRTRGLTVDVLGAAAAAAALLAVVLLAHRTPES